MISEERFHQFCQETIEPEFTNFQQKLIENPTPMALYDAIFDEMERAIWHYDIHYMQFSLSITNILLDRLPYFIELYDDRQYLGGYLDATLFEPFYFRKYWQQLMTHLQKEAKKYLGKIASYEIADGLIPKLSLVNQCLIQELQEYFLRKSHSILLERVTIRVGFYRFFQKNIFA